MEMRQKRMSVYKTMMRRRAFTNWANSVLRSLDKQIVDIFNPTECALLEALLQIVLAKSEKKFKHSSQGRKKSERETILSRAKEFKKNYFKSEQEQGNYGLILSTFNPYMKLTKR
jgi:hypothetical protein